MKKIYALSLALAVAGSAMAATTLDQARIYLNPGHGSWGPNDRPMATIPYPNLANGMPDTCGFYESNTNLWKVLKIGATLEKLGVKHENIIYSRVKNGPYPYKAGDPDAEKFNRALSEICEEVCANNIDMFLSVHSNAATEGANTNYPLFEYRGKDGKGNEYVPGSFEMCESVWPRLYTNAIDVTSYYSIANSNIRGDFNFNSTWDETGRTDPTTGVTYYGKLGVMKHNAPGLLSEGYFHTYQPARHRALNKDYCAQEGVRYARGIADYFGAAGETTGYIMGTVKDLHEKMTNSLYKYASGSIDQWVPINGAVVKLLKDGKEVSSYTVDNNYNGVFVFENLEPGKYTLQASATGYKEAGEDYTAPFEVKANETTYPKIYLESESYEPPKIVYTDYPDPVQDSSVGVPSTMNMEQKFADNMISKLDGLKVRRSILRNDTITVLAFGENNKPFIYQFNPETQEFIREISTEGIPEIDTTTGGVFKISDIAFTADNKLVACNKCKTQYDDSQIETGDIRGVFRCFIWNDLATTPIEWATSKLSGNYYHAWTGNTIAVSGASNECTIVTTTVTTGSSAALRFLKLVVADNQVVEDGYMKSNYTELALGADHKLTLSPRGKNQYVIDGSKSTPSEFGVAVPPSSVPELGKINSDLINASATGATFFKYAKHSFMTSPMTDADGKNVGVSLFDVTNGLDKANLIKTTNTTISPVETSEMMAAGVVKNADISIYMMRDKSESKFSSIDVDQPVVKGILAYDLRVNESGENYVITYKSNSNSTKSELCLTNAETGKYCGSISIPNSVMGENTVTIKKSDLPYISRINWSIKLYGDNVGKVAKLSNSGIGAFGQGCVAVNNSTESDKFGYVYVGSAAKSGIVNPGLYEYTNDLVQNKYVASTEGSSRRLSIDSKGNVYVAHWSDGLSGVYFYDATNLDNNWNIFNHNNDAIKASSGLWSLNDTPIGGSTTGVSVIGSGNDTWLYTYDEDYLVNGSGNNVLMYHLGDATEINAAPDREYGGSVHSLTVNTDVNVVASTHGGFWASQTRKAGNNTQSVPALMYFDADGNPTFNSGKDLSDVLDGCNSGGYAVNYDESLLAITDASNNIVVLDLTWTDNVPTLKYKYKFPYSDAYTTNGVYQMAFDRGNNIYITGSTLGVYTALTDNNTCNIPAKSTLVLIGNTPVAPLEFAVTDNKDNTVTATWTAPSANAIAYKLYLDDVKVDSISTSTFTFTNVTFGSHTFGVSAIYPYDVESEKSEVTLATSGVETISSDSNVTITPNPTTGIINITCPEQIVEVHVYSVNGSLVAQGNDSVLDISNIASGIYFVKVNNYDAVRIIKK